MLVWNNQILAYDKHSLNLVLKLLAFSVSFCPMVKGPKNALLLY